MKKTAFVLLLACIATIGYGLEFSTLEQPITLGVLDLSSVFQPSSSTSSYIENLNKLEEAGKARDYKKAREILQKMIDDYSSSTETEAGLASDYVQLALYDWCLEKDSEAKDALSKAIKLMENGKSLGGGCEARAEVLLKKISKLPRRMSYDEIQAVLNYTTDPVFDRFHETISRKNAQIDALTRKFESETNSLRRQGDFQASMNKFYAKQEYEKSAGRTFDPNTRPKNEKDLEKWEACKRVYDIWEP